jgi:hypothetical protein
MTTANSVPYRQIRALFTEHTVTVYQAYPPEIAEPALTAGTFTPPFKVERMTWIKPSFLWMMYRSGWAKKIRQERILAIEITREGFEWALGHCVLSHYEPSNYLSYQEWTECKHTSLIRVQWDPERSIFLQPLPWRSIQIGLSGEAVNRYTHEWIVNITDLTATAHELHELVTRNRVHAASAILPSEEPYAISERLRRLIDAT